MKLEGRRIRNIRVERQLGRGGMGRVYLGFDEVLERRVALKVIRSSRRLDPENMARFLREARTLSALEHPNICRIYDFVDDEASGREILVLEYVEGRTLGALMKVGLDERTKFVLVTQLAQALEAAHAAGIIHRDLKPDNVMWTPEGRVKVLDFGLARGLDDPVQVPANWSEGEDGAGDDDFGTVPVRWAVTGDETATVVPRAANAGTSQGGLPTTSGTSGTAVTELGSIVGTIAYMSPEQAQGRPLTTASDMYSFGLLCQELFTGRSPYPEETSRLVRLKNVALAETVPVEGVDRELADLIERLLSKVPDARPRAADALERLERIRDRPRRRLRRLAGVLVALALLAAGAKYTFDLRREQARTQAALVQAERARAEAQRVTDFLVDVFEVSDPGEARGNEITAREVLDRGVERIDTELSGEPRIQARLLATMGDVHHQLGLYQEAAALLERSVELARRLESEQEAQNPTDRAMLADGLFRLGDTYFFLDRYDEAEALVRESLDLRRAVHGEAHPSVAAARGKLGELRYDRGDLEGAREHLELAVATLRAHRLHSGAFGGTLGRTLRFLADIEADEGRTHRAEELYEEALVLLARRPGEDHPVFATTLQGLAQVYLNQGRYDEAEPLVLRSLEVRRRIYQGAHPTLGISYSLLGFVEQGQGDLQQAKEYLQQGYEVFLDSLDPNHFNIGANRLLVGNLNVELEQWDEAEKAFEQSLAVWRDSGLENNYNAVATREGLADLAFGRGRHEEALERYRTVADQWLEQIGESTLEYLTVRLGTARALHRLGRLEESARVLAAIRPVLEEMIDSEPTPDAVVARAELHLLAGRVSVDRGDASAARREYEQALVQVETLESHDHQPDLMALRAQLLLRLGRVDESRPLLDRLRDRNWRDSELWQLAAEDVPGTQSSG